MLTLSLDLRELRVPESGLHAKLEGKGELHHLCDLRSVKEGVQLGGAWVPRYRLWVRGPTSKFCIAVFPYGCESREFHQLHIALLPRFLWAEVGSFVGAGNTLYGGVLII